MVYKVEEIEGIGPAYAAKLREAGIVTTDHLLKLCGTAAGRKATSERTGVNESVLLRWANLADLMRVSGIGSQYSELLEAAGVDTVRELATRNAENLTSKMESVNREKKLARATPTSSVVRRWIAAAGELEAAITH